jgi:ABC-type branched-subunit amino acid transport system substrate-binding protein
VAAPGSPRSLVPRLAALLVAAAVAAAEPDETTDAREPDLKFGMSTALTGPAADLGLEMRAGVELAFEEVNRAGGIKGRRLALVALDDGYEPGRAAPNMVELLDVERVLGVVGNVGTPTAVAALPVALDRKALFYGAFTGAGTLRRTPPDRYVVNFRASYAQETGAMVDALIDEAGLKPEEIAFFTQRDSYGDAGFAGGVAALKRHGLVDETGVTYGRYDRNTVAVESALAEIMSAAVRPRAVILVGAYAPCAAFVKLARANGLEAIFLNVSFVGTRPLIQALGADGEGVIITQVVPPLDADLPILARYRGALALSEHPVEESFGSLEGYVSAQILCRALETLESAPTRESIVDALERLGSFDVGLGVPLELSRQRHQACDRVWPTVVRGGRAVALDWAELKAARSAAGSH